MAKLAHLQAWVCVAFKCAYTSAIANYFLTMPHLKLLIEWLYLFLISLNESR